MNTIKLIIFDLDGTIIDSGRTVLKLLNYLRTQLNLPQIKISDISKALSMGGKELIEIALGREVNIQENLQSFRSLYLADQLELDQLYPGVLEYMKWLRQNGLKIGICTNKPDKIVEKILKQQGIMNYIDYLVADDGFRPKKPNPQGLLQILASAKLNADQAIMIGDSSVDQIAAKLANIKFIFHQSGYDDGVLVEKNTIVIKSYFELIGKKNE